MQNDQSINVMSSGEWIRTLLSKSKKSIKKSANISGTAGYVPMPDAYDGLKGAIKNKKKLKDQAEALYTEQVKEEVDSAPDFVKGGPGSGVKGHRTERNNIPTKIYNVLNKYEYMESLNEHQLEKFRKDVESRVEVTIEEYTSVVEVENKLLAHAVGDSSERKISIQQHIELISKLKIIHKDLGKAFSPSQIKMAIDNAINLAHTTGEHAILLGGGVITREESKAVKKYLDYIRDQRTHKAANITALSGTAGYVPMPDAYDGLKGAIKNKKKLKEQADALYAELAEQVKEEVDRYISYSVPDFVKGGVGSGIKGHRTEKKEDREFAAGIQIKKVEGTEDELAGIELGKIKLGECFTNAGRYLFSHSNVDGKLVHGQANLIKEKPYRFGHSWVELPGNKVFDGTANQFFDKSDYYKKLKAKKIKEYNFIEILEILDKKQTWGPWENIPAIEAIES